MNNFANAYAGDFTFGLVLLVISGLDNQVELNK